MSKNFCGTEPRNQHVRLALTPSTKAGLDTLSLICGTNLNEFCNRLFEKIIIENADVINSFEGNRRQAESRLKFSFNVNADSSV